MSLSNGMHDKLKCNKYFAVDVGLVDYIRICDIALAKSESYWPPSLCRYDF